MPLRKFGRAYFPDTVVVYPLGYSADADAGPVQTPGVGVALACGVELAGPPAEGEADAIPAGTTRYTLRFAGDPGVNTTDVPITWTHHDGVALTSPVPLLSTGSSNPPSGLGVLWRVGAVAKQ